MLQWLTDCVSLSLFSRPLGGQHCHTVPDQQNRAWQNSQTMDEEIRHIDCMLQTHPLLNILHPSVYLSTSLSPLVCQSTLTKCNSKPALLSPTSSSALSILSVYFLCKNKRKEKETNNNKKNVLCSLLTWKLLFYTKSRLGFLFSNIWMLEVLYWRKKKQNIIMIIHFPPAILYVFSFP